MRKRYLILFPLAIRLLSIWRLNILETSLFSNKEPGSSLDRRRLEWWERWSSAICKRFCNHIYLHLFYLSLYFFNICDQLLEVNDKNILKWQNTMNKMCIFWLCSNFLCSHSKSFSKPMEGLVYKDKKYQIICEEKMQNILFSSSFTIIKHLSVCIWDK